MSLLQARQLAELSASGAVIGVLGGAVVGGLAAFAGQPAGWALTGAVALAVPLALLGAAYGVLVGLGWAKPGMFTPVALLWLVGYPFARLAHEMMTPALLGGNPAPPDDVVGFLIYQALISLGFAIGFIWLYERITPAWLKQIKDHNPYAQRVYARYLAHAEQVWAAREYRRARRRGSPPATSPGAPRTRSRRSS
ncbi:MAG TPA: hypothetical protein VKZ81_31540 [Pseudonocardia sp.]|jgi:hypothetical protein|uniref:hypothetical protein n=1 Tax=Pseudonocardia sp. TaxID=60912 RepID=UPI002B4B20E3|nr:hypothetical protein [Pseudonocardia sp.]HLU60017.1 hypothetical protein [Pseudonocardia sp.]